MMVIGGTTTSRSSRFSVLWSLTTTALFVFWSTTITTTTNGFVIPKRHTTPTRLHYDVQRDPPNENVWSVLANTERWIASTLKESQTPSGNNPLSRKEVSYVCETSQDPAMILANVFRKLKEARQLGEQHGQEQEELCQQEGRMCACVGPCDVYG
jgi:hypothetical protein